MEIWLLQSYFILLSKLPGCMVIRQEQPQLLHWTDVWALTLVLHYILYTLLYSNHMGVECVYASVITLLENNLSPKLQISFRLHLLDSPTFCYIHFTHYLYKLSRMCCWEAPQHPSAATNMLHGEDGTFVMSGVRSYYSTEMENTTLMYQIYIFNYCYLNVLFIYLWIFQREIVYSNLELFSPFHCLHLNI